VIDVEVLIVGGGPVGLSLACELGWRGVRCLVVEQGPEFGEEPVAKINLVNARSMEFCRRWGIERELRHCGFPDDYPMTILFATSMRGKLIARAPYPSMGEQGAHPASPTNRQRIPQGLLDPLLRRAAQRFESVDCAFRTRLERFVDRGDRVEAEIVELAGGRRETVRARYLAACDGAHSPVREALSVPLEGEQRISYSCGIYFRSPRLWRQHDKGKAIMNVLVDRGGMWANLNMIDGFKTWRLSVVGGERFVPPEELDVPGALRRAMGGPFDCEVVGLYPWVRRAVVAQRFRVGRCFLVGDAAHQLSPTGGFGMNTGMGEAVDLGWKLDAVLRGWGGEGLLDSYEAERRPIAERNVREATVNFRNLQALPTFPWIEDDGPDADARRAELGSRFYALTRAEWESWGVQFGYRYDPSPVCVPDGTAAPTDDPIAYAPTARPGSRAPHAWIAPERSTLDLFGRGFALLDFGAAAAEAEAIVRAARARGVPVTRQPIPDPAIRALYERRLVLVRPDGHVAWRGDTAPEDSVALWDVLRGAGATTGKRTLPGIPGR
jgi:2-polyprenyl-6-methoxyphenol hydroxylase-like FAD-dependent oxidoreductase